MSSEQTNAGLCQCGCGTPTKFDRKKRAYNDFAPGHWNRKHSKRGEVGTDFLVQDRGFETPCWVWQGAIDTTTGYGRVSYEGRNIGAHRAAYLQAHGSIPEGHDVHHRCTVGACVNPEHLEALPRAEHAQSKPDPRSKLTPEQVREIRVRAKALGSYKPASRVLAAEYGVTQWCIRNILRGQRWRNVR